jgi:C4-dicarboxylate-specific signal transduction histidine kinase
VPPEGRVRQTARTPRHVWQASRRPDAAVHHATGPSRIDAELEADQLRHKLAHMSRVTTMGELAASIAHELNQPLTSALTNAQTALRFLSFELPNVDEVCAILHDIAADARRAADVIRRLRSMLTTGAVEQVDVDLNRIVAEVFKLVGSDARLCDVSLESELVADLPHVRGDRIQLQQVLLNLVVNGMDAMKNDGSKERRLTIRTHTTDRHTARVEVGDSGRGIDHVQLAQIFQPFVTTKIGGLGMGLSIARSIVEAHGGQIWAMNNADRGATFVFTLPLA